MQNINQKVLDLRRGGVVITTSAGIIQYGISPETIKDTMGLECGVPEIYLVPDNLFLEDRGVSMADLEFPIYYNFFFRGVKTQIICTADQKKRLSVIIREAIFGPVNLQSICDDFPHGESSYGFPDFKKEMSFFRRHPKNGRRMGISDLVKFIVFDQKNEIHIGEVKIHNQKGEWFTIFDNEQEIAMIPSRIYMLTPPMKVDVKQDFVPPHFGLSIIGSGTGFDPNEMTSGFILWINRQGILVDPPVDTTAWLQANRINPKMVGTVIITHCHADHDAGTLQKILEEGRVKVVTTRTIMKSFTRKYRSLLDVTPEKFKMLFDFHPVRIGEPFHLHGGSFVFHYTLHAIPTVMFDVSLGGKSLLYTADHCNDPGLIKSLHQQGILSDSRCEDLLEFDWNHDLILHEAGPPPIHTPLSSLKSLPMEVKKKILLVHVNKKDIDKKSGLKVAESGIENTVSFKIAEPKVSLALQILDVLTRIDFFHDLNISMAKQFLELVKVEHFSDGDTIIEKGTEGNRFYMILEGVAGVVIERDKPDLKIYGKNDYFGETALILEDRRNAWVIARSEMTCITMAKADFLKFLEGTPILARFKRVAENRRHQTWKLFQDSHLFAAMSNAQKTDIQSIMIKEECKAGQTLAVAGKLGEFSFLVESGKLVDLHKNEIVSSSYRSDITGFIPIVLKGKRYPFTIQAEIDTIVYRIDAMEFKKFLTKNPGVLMHFEKNFKQD